MDCASPSTYSICGGDFVTQERQKMRTEGTSALRSYPEVVTSAPATEKKWRCERRTVAEMAAKWGKESWETMRDLMIEADLLVAFCMFCRNNGAASSQVLLPRSAVRRVELT